MATNKTLIRSCLFYEYINLLLKLQRRREKYVLHSEMMSLSDRTVQKRFKKFPSGDLSLADEERCGRPKNIRKEDLKKIVQTHSSTGCIELVEMFVRSPETTRLYLVCTVIRFRIPGTIMMHRNHIFAVLSNQFRLLEADTG